MLSGRALARNAISHHEPRWMLCFCCFCCFCCCCRPYKTPHRTYDTSMVHRMFAYGVEKQQKHTFTLIHMYIVWRVGQFIWSVAVPVPIEMNWFHSHVIWIKRNQNKKLFQFLFRLKWMRLKIRAAAAVNSYAKCINNKLLFVSLLLLWLWFPLKFFQFFFARIHLEISEKNDMRWKERKKMQIILTYFENFTIAKQCK